MPTQAFLNAAWQGVKKSHMCLNQISNPNDKASPLKRRTSSSAYHGKGGCHGFVGQVVQR